MEYSGYYKTNIMLTYLYAVRLVKCSHFYSNFKQTSFCENLYRIIRHVYAILPLL